MLITELTWNQMPENKDDIDLDGWDLHRAARENRVDIARALIVRGDDVNAREGKEADLHGTHGWTPLAQGSREEFPRSSPPVDRARSKYRRDRPEVDGCIDLESTLAVNSM